MNVASMKLSKELYELSEWDDTEKIWVTAYPDYQAVELRAYFGNQISDSQYSIQCPAYDLGYLLRKLPIYLPPAHSLDARIRYLTLHPANGGRWTVYYQDSIFLLKSDTPEDAVCKLTCMLFKQKIIKREDKETQP